MEFTGKQFREAYQLQHEEYTLEMDKESPLRIEEMYQKSKPILAKINFEIGDTMDILKICGKIKHSIEFTTQILERYLEEEERMSVKFECVKREWTSTVVEFSIPEKEIINKVKGMIKSAPNKYNAYQDSYKELEGIFEDIKHEVALGKKRGVKSGYELYTMQREALRERYYKRDLSDMIHPLAEWCEKHQNLISELSRVCSEIEQQEKRLRKRLYSPRVMNPEELTMKTNEEAEEKKNKPLKDPIKEQLEKVKKKDVLSEYQQKQSQKKKHKYL